MAGRHRPGKWGSYTWAAIIVVVAFIAYLLYIYESNGFINLIP